MDSVTFIKFISTLLYPVGFISLTTLVGLFFFKLRNKRLGRRSIVLSLIVFILSSNVSVANWLTANLESRYPQQEIQKIPVREALIVLGGGLRMPIEPAKHVQLGSASDRYWYAVKLYQAGKAEKIILSAGNFVKQEGLESEAFYARELLIAWGVPRDVILIEEKSRTTSENKDFTANILEYNNIHSALLVTSAMHMPRAYSLFADLPYEITPASADVIVRNGKVNSSPRWLPSASAMHLTTLAVHEYYGLLYNELNALIDKLL